MKNSTNIITGALIILFALTSFSCREKTPTEKAAETIEETMEEIEDEIDDATK